MQDSTNRFQYNILVIIGVLLIASCSSVSTTAMSPISLDHTVKNLPSSVIQNSPQSEVEPNNDVQSSTPLQSNSSIGGTITNESDIDVYRVNSTQGSTLRTDLKRSSGQGTFGIAIYGPEISYRTGIRAEVGNRTELTADVNQTGSYYVVVAPIQQFIPNESGQAGVGEYTLAVNTTNFDSSVTNQTTTTTTTSQTSGDKFEPNDNIQSSSPTQPNTLVSGSVDGKDLDIYSVDVSSGTIRIDLTRPGGQGTLGVAIYGPEQSLRTGIRAEVGNQTTLTADVNQSGTYYVVVAPIQAFVPNESEPIGNGPYDFVVSTSSVSNGTEPVSQEAEVESEPNDSPSDSTPLKRGSTIRGKLTNSSDVDWFSMKASEGELIIAQVIGADEKGIEYSLYNQANRQITRAVTAEGGSQIQWVALENGIYRLKVNSTGGTGQYSVYVRVPRASERRFKK